MKKTKADMFSPVEEFGFNSPAISKYDNFIFELLKLIAVLKKDELLSFQDINNFKVIHS